MPYGASIVVWRELDGSRQFLLLHRAHEGADYEGDWAWTPPAGARLPGEVLEDCIRRELREETGLELRCRTVGVAGEWALALARAPAGAPVILDAEHDRYDWLPLDVALGRCLPASVAAGLSRAAAAIR
jgi:8-oxo-dGTP pyrophosphatase MutT (NUDIX family)